MYYSPSNIQYRHNSTIELHGWQLLPTNTTHTHTKTHTHIYTHSPKATVKAKFSAFFFPFFSTSSRMKSSNCTCFCLTKVNTHILIYEQRQSSPLTCTLSPKNRHFSNKRQDEGLTWDYFFRVIYTHGGIFWRRRIVKTQSTLTYTNIHRHSTIKQIYDGLIYAVVPCTARHSSTQGRICLILHPIVHTSQFAEEERHKIES